MRTITGQAHREQILKAFFPGARILEWGLGGSTLWFADRLPEGATLTSIDHDTTWHDRVKAKMGSRENVRLLVFPPSKPIGRNATLEEENPAPVQEYIHAMDGESFDVILVDGVARSSCMEAAVGLLRAGGRIFLHDAQRPWYDASKSLFNAHGTIGSCPEYPGPTLWWGGLEPERPRFSIGALPIVISFFTLDTPYEEEAKKLRISLERLGMEADIQGVPSRGSWERNCAYKARYILDAYFRHDRPVLWLDADSVVHGHPLLVAGAMPDFAVHRVDGWEMASGTIYFNRTPLGQLLLETWVRYCEARPDIWDQIHLDRAWEEVTANNSLYTMWLPQSYTKIFDRFWDKGQETATPVIEQFQASRRFKASVSYAAPKRMRQPSTALIAARRAGRPRECFYDDRFVLLHKAPNPDPWALNPENDKINIAAFILRWMRSLLK